MRTHSKPVSKPGKSSVAVELLVLAGLLAFAPSASADVHSGRSSASAVSRVSMSFPSVHGMNVPSAPATSTSTSSVVFASRSARGSVETLPLQLVSTNGQSAVQMVRTVRTGNAGSIGLASTRGAADSHESLEVRSSAREGALGWSVMNDRVALPSTSTVSSGGSSKATVVYEIWDF